MEIRYDHVANAMYIKLTDHLIVTTKRVTPNLNVDLDEHNQLIGIEIVSVREAGIDPLTMALTHVTSMEHVEPPDEEAMRQGRIARAEARKRQREAQNAKP